MAQRLSVLCGYLTVKLWKLQSSRQRVKRSHPDCVFKLDTVSSLVSLGSFKSVLRVSFQVSCLLFFRRHFCIHWLWFMNRCISAQLFLLNSKIKWTLHLVAFPLLCFSVNTAKRSSSAAQSPTSVAASERHQGRKSGRGGVGWVGSRVEADADNQSIRARDLKWARRTLWVVIWWPR